MIQSKSLLRKKVVFSLIIILAWMALMVTGVRAFFSTNTTISDNVISSGSVDLLLDTSGDSQPHFSDSAPGFYDDVYPGSIGEYHYLWVKETSKNNLNLALDMRIFDRMVTFSESVRDNFSLEIEPVDENNNSMGVPVFMTWRDMENTRVPLKFNLLDGRVQKFRFRVVVSSALQDQSLFFHYDLIMGATQL